MPDAPPSFEAYLAALPEERRAVVARVRQTVRDHMLAGYAERVVAKSLSFVVDGEVYCKRRFEKLQHTDVGPLDAFHSPPAVVKADLDVPIWTDIPDPHAPRGMHDIGSNEPVDSGYCIQYSNSCGD